MPARNAGQPLGAFILLALICLTLASVVWRIEAERRATAAAEGLVALRTEIATGQPGPAPAPLVADFSSKLPRDADIDGIVNDLQRSTAKLGITFVSVTVTHRAATSSRFGRADLAFVLRGSYSQIKTLLADTLNRFPHLILQRLHFRRQSAPTELEASLGFEAVSRPAFEPAQETSPGADQGKTPTR